MVQSTRKVRLKYCSGLTIVEMYMREVNYKVEGFNNVNMHIKSSLQCTKN